MDFDNVFGGLLKLDPPVALTFARAPELWLRRLASTLVIDGDRRFLVLRCYLNPNGWVPHPERPGERLYFSEFRPPYTRAGFDVVDCPRITHTKNAADIRLVVDAMDAVRGTTRYDEFVIASGDSDMTPLLVRLRAEDRRTTVVSPSDAAAGFIAVADRSISGVQVLELVQGEPVEEEPEDEFDEEAGEPLESGTAPIDVATTAPSDQDTTRALQRATEMVRSAYDAADGPINVASLAARVRAEVGQPVVDTQWFGAEGFVRFVRRLALPGAVFSQHELWDSTRHDAPASTESGQPPAIQRVRSALSLPRLGAADWQAVYDELAEYAQSHRPFNLTECTRWTRDRLSTLGVPANRSAVGVVARGSAYGGAPLFREPAPGSDEIRDAFAANTLSRAEAAGIPLTNEERVEIKQWLAAPPG
ncbi:hypothetical protein GCM10009858_05200 [Terrabacter carboxydivorans]|uniref:NYN domain-containing protein n=1 Tax=Terrabacter carboxydivorans TaxID=619730 RepID=A0ABN3KVB9_9MICO